MKVLFIKIRFDEDDFMFFDIRTPLDFLRIQLLNIQK